MSNVTLGVCVRGEFVLVRVMVLDIGYKEDYHCNPHAYQCALVMGCCEGWGKAGMTVLGCPEQRKW